MSVYHPTTSTLKNLQLSRYFLERFTAYVIDNTTYGNCTLIAKATAISSTSTTDPITLQLLGKICTYGLLRYFLWFLMTGQETLAILLDQFTPFFYAVLQASPDYSQFMAAFLDPTIAGANVYFKVSLPLPPVPPVVVEVKQKTLSHCSVVAVC